MAEFTELDAVLRAALQHAAQSGDPTGVADAIRSRVAAGDPGASVASSTAPGWGGRVWSWLPWLGLVVVAGLVGGGVGASGLAGRPTESVELPAPVIAQVSVDALACIAGPVADAIPAGTPVLATLRSADGSWVGVRSPSGDGSVVWIAAAALTLDAGQPELASLPVGGACPVVVTPAPTPTAEPTQAPAPAPQNPAPAPQNPAPDPDTSAPSVQASADQSKVYWVNGTATTITATASDDRGVTHVSISWSGYASGSAQMSGGGSTWSYLFDPEEHPGVTVPAGAQITFVVTAHDAAGNTATSSVIVQVSS